MAVPTFDELFLPFLRVAEQHGQVTMADARELIAADLQLSDEDRQELLPSGRQGRFDNRVGWARTYLGKAGLIRTVRRGVFELSEAGKQLLATNPTKVDLDTLSNYESFREWGEASRAPQSSPSSTAQATSVSEDSETPEEAMDEAYAIVRQSLASDIAEALQGVSWRKFEQIVIDLLLALGYGGSRAGAGHAFRKGGDEGVDGVINEDRLGLSKIYVQAKKYAPERRVSRPDVQAFVGSLIGQKARQGVFITTSGFTREAQTYVERLSDQQVVLIDGELLAEYMMDHNVGVSEKTRFVIKRLDTGYFEEE